MNQERPFPADYRETVLDPLPNGTLVTAEEAGDFVHRVGAMKLGKMRIKTAASPSVGRRHLDPTDFSPTAALTAVVRWGSRSTRCRSRNAVNSSVGMIVRFPTLQAAISRSAISS